MHCYSGRVQWQSPAGVEWSHVCRICIQYLFEVEPNLCDLFFCNNLTVSLLGGPTMSSYQLYSVRDATKHLVNLTDVIVKIDNDLAGWPSFNYTRSIDQFSAV